MALIILICIIKTYNKSKNFQKTSLSPPSRKWGTLGGGNLSHLLCTLWKLLSTFYQWFPIHTLLAAAVENSSSYLLKTLNPFGYMYSTNTLSIYQRQLEKVSTISKYPNTAFTIVLADNIDFLHTYVRVYSGGQPLSWHSINIQAILYIVTAISVYYLQ